MLICISLSIAFWKDICLKKNPLNFKANIRVFIVFLGEWTIESMLAYFGRKRIREKFSGYRFSSCLVVV